MHFKQFDCLPNPTQSSLKRYEEIYELRAVTIWKFFTNTITTIIIVNSSNHMKLPKITILFLAISDTCIVERNFNRSTLSYVTIVCIMFWIVEHLMNNKLDMGSILYEGDSHKSGVIGKTFMYRKRIEAKNPIRYLVQENIFSTF